MVSYAQLPNLQLVLFSFAKDRLIGVSSSILDVSFSFRWRSLVVSELHYLCCLNLGSPCPPPARRRIDLEDTYVFSWMNSACFCDATWTHSVKLDMYLPPSSGAEPFVLPFLVWLVTTAFLVEKAFSF